MFRTGITREVFPSTVRTFPIEAREDSGDDKEGVFVDAIDRLPRFLYCNWFGFPCRRILFAAYRFPHRLRAFFPVRVIVAPLSPFDRQAGALR